MIAIAVLVVASGFGTSCGDTAETDPAHTVRLSVSNQTFAIDDSPSIAVFIDGDFVLSGDFTFGGTHVWINTDVRLPSGAHELSARALYSLEKQGQVGDRELITDIAFDLDADQWARLALEFDPTVDDTPRFEWVIDSEPILLR
jgi:hypothetical protein